MASFDVKSLFTNIPVTFTIHAIYGKNGDKDSEFNGLSKTKMLKLLQ